MHIRITARATEPSHLAFHVSAVHAEGFALPLWQGPSYERALLVAAAASRDLGPVRDRVLETCPRHLLPEL